MRDKTIQFLINEKDNLWNELEDLMYIDILTPTYKPLTPSDITKINDLRKQIFDIYKLIEKIGEINL